MSNHHKKRFFVLLMILALFTIISIAVFFWLGITSNYMVTKIVLWFLLAFVFSLTLIFSLGIFLLVQRIHYGKDIGIFGPIIKGSIKFLFPIIMALCEIFNIDKDKVRGSFININNELLLSSQAKTIEPGEILILLPHCVQNAKCKFNVTADIKNCTKCGNCDINGIIDIANKYHVNVAIATGGTLARKIIKDKRPKGVLAVACERDLSSGILDCDPLPVIGILNLRPNGPCFNTGVDLRELEASIKNFVKEEI